MAITINKAIEILELAKDDPDAIDINDLFDAEDLALEALKEAQRWRAGQPLHLPNLLPGESTD